ncbi:CRISPR-associated protein Cmr5 [Clostridium liquoris]|uniref:CRISPR type III-B/RAMP module-associated protein Cmr5 n=1 Tax=Clostridium liquoris TaxID=1289519 RepID=A0A2T0B211_9CLOT|nr:type III-B CRISPR module-associated protein Cmr5 [Clostridium liquoris]PRR77940.1 CRISPR-associated protein Cmr5 [Clostridium liquoris]
MNKREIEKQIPIAINLINQYIKDEKFYKKTDDKNFGQIPQEYKGYISNFGASLIQSGLVSTVAFFEADDSKSNCDRRILTKLILDVIYKNKNLKIEEDKNLLSYILVDNSEKDIRKEEVINAAIAVKLAIKVFKLTENNES